MAHSKSKHKRKYKSKNPKISQEKAAIYGQRIGELIDIKRRNKGSAEITPGELIRDASFPSSPLHEYFEWDNSKAAHEYRLCQARWLLCAIVVENDFEHKAFVNVKNEENKLVYVELDDALEHPPYIKQLLAECRRYMEGFNKTLRLLEEHL